MRTTPTASVIDSSGSQNGEMQPGLRQATPRLRDKLGRVITDLRVSVTDRCNYKCVYCRTGNEGAQFAELKKDEYLRMIRVFVSLGIEKVRLTGGEPLLRNDLVDIVASLSGLTTLSDHRDGSGAAQPLDIAITTNGHLLEGCVDSLKDAGLSRITVSMDAVDAQTFARITRVPGSLRKCSPVFAPPKGQA